MPAVGYVVVTLEFREEDGQWVGVCEQLGTVAQARTLDEVKEALEELVIEHLKTLDELGERERFFQEHGIKLYTDESMPTSVPKRLLVAHDIRLRGRGRGPIYTTYSTRVPAAAIA